MPSLDSRFLEQKSIYGIRKINEQQQTKRWIEEFLIGINSAAAAVAAAAVAAAAATTTAADAAAAAAAAAAMSSSK